MDIGEPKRIIEVIPASLPIPGELAPEPAPLEPDHVEPDHVEPDHVEPNHVEPDHVEPAAPGDQGAEP